MPGEVGAWFAAPTLLILVGSQVKANMNQKELACFGIALNLGVLRWCAMSNHKAPLPNRRPPFSFPSHYFLNFANVVSFCLWLLETTMEPKDNFCLRSSRVAASLIALIINCKG